MKTPSRLKTLIAGTALLTAHSYLTHYAYSEKPPTDAELLEKNQPVAARQTLTREQCEKIAQCYDLQAHIEHLNQRITGAFNFPGHYGGPSIDGPVTILSARKTVRALKTDMTELDCPPDLNYHPANFPPPECETPPDESPLPKGVYEIMGSRIEFGGGTIKRN